MNGQKIFNIDPSWVGGTELMALKMQEKVLPIAPQFSDWNWILVPGEINLREDGKNIVWVHLGEFEGDLRWLANPKVAHIIFVSYYQYQRFMEWFPDIDSNKCHVIRNAINPITPSKYPSIDKIKLIFQSEPYRGLDILLKAISLIKDESIELNVFGDLHTTTIDWKIDFQNKIKAMCEEDSRVVLHGRQPNDVVREQIRSSHMFAYPSTWRETSCISLIEALSGGLYCITNSFTVLPETGIGLTNMYPYNPDPDSQSITLADKIIEGIDDIRSGRFDQISQIVKANNYYSWNTVSKEWLRFADKISMNS
jgi:glycosyltransferase involved in cell wall biosynthesis